MTIVFEYSNIYSLTPIFCDKIQTLKHKQRFFPIVSIVWVVSNENIFYKLSEDSNCTHIVIFLGKQTIYFLIEKKRRKIIKTVNRNPWTRVQGCTDVKLFPHPTGAKKKTYLSQRFRFCAYVNRVSIGLSAPLTLCLYLTAFVPCDI